MLGVSRWGTDFVQDCRGTIGVTFALTLLVAICAAAMSIDYGRALHAKSRLQNAVDTGAIAGASLPATSNANREAAVQRFFGGNLRSTPLSGVLPVIRASNASVTVSASYNYPTVLMGLLRVNSLTVLARAQAKSQVQNGGVACLIALNPTTVDGVHLQGINKMSSDKCWVWVNSTNSQSINAVGASQGLAQGFCTAGGVSGAEHFSPVPFTGCDPMPDPFVGKSAPAPGSCTGTNVQLKSGTFTLNPGTYCGGLVLKPHAEVTFNPGLYVIKDGRFEIQGQASATGDGVVFVFTGNSAEFIVRGGGNATFRAPPADAVGVSGLQGFVLFQDQWTTTAGRSTSIQGGGSVALEGVLYFPTWRVEIGGNGDINQTSRYFAMVADSFYMEGNGKLHIQAEPAAAGLPDLMPAIKNGPLLLD